MKKQNKTIKEEFREFMKQELLAITPYDEKKVLEFIKRVLQRFIEETTNIGVGNDYDKNYLLKEIHQKQTKWLKEKL